MIERTTIHSHSNYNSRLNWKDLCLSASSTVQFSLYTAAAAAAVAAIDYTLATQDRPCCGEASQSAVPSRGIVSYFGLARRVWLTRFGLSLLRRPSWPLDNWAHVPLD